MKFNPEHYTVYTVLQDATIAVDGTYLTADDTYEALDQKNPKYLVRYVVAHNGREYPAIDWMQLYRQDNDLR